MDAIRQYFVLKRIQTGASEYHLRPREVQLDESLELHVEWDETTAPAAKKRAAREDNVEPADTPRAKKREEEDDSESEEDGTSRAKKREEEDAESEEDGTPRVKKREEEDSESEEDGTPRAKKRAGEEDAESEEEPKVAEPHHQIAEDYVCPDNPCPCGCQTRVWKSYKVGGYSCIFGARGGCIFEGGRCACGCENAFSEEVWREMRLEQTTVQTDEGWNTWRKETDSLLQKWVHKRYDLAVDVQRLESNIASRQNPGYLLRRLKKEQTRLYVVDARIARRRELLAAKGEAKDEADEEKAPLKYGGRCTVLDIDKSTLSRETIIDGMCTAVQRCHTLRVLHRNIRIENFAIQHFIDDNGEAAAPIDGGELPRHRPTVVLRGWDHACFNPGNTAYRNDKRNTFEFPDWGEVAPEMSGDSPARLEYGFEYDMWCLGLCIFQIMYDTALPDEVDPAEFTDAWLKQWIAAHPTTMPNACLYEILLTVILTTNATKRACSYAAMNMTDGPRSVLFDRQMETFNAEKASEGLTAKFPLAPNIGKMLSAWVGGTGTAEQRERRGEMAQRKQCNLARQAQRAVLDTKIRLRDMRNQIREIRRTNDQEVSDDESGDSDIDVSDDEVVEEVMIDSGDAFLEFLRDWDYAPKCLTAPGVHWHWCKCEQCQMIPRPPVLAVDDKSRTELTRVMYSMLAASTNDNLQMEGHKLIILFSQLAKAVLGDEPMSRIDLDRWGFNGEKDFRKKLSQCCDGLRDLRIRL